jgi:hypothetical protein
MYDCERRMFVGRGNAEPRPRDDEALNHEVRGTGRTGHRRPGYTGSTARTPGIPESRTGRPYTTSKWLG